MTLYVCTDRGRHPRRRLGVFDETTLVWIAQARGEVEDPWAGLMRDMRSHDQWWLLEVVPVSPEGERVPMATDFHSRRITPRRSNLQGTDLPDDAERTPASGLLFRHHATDSVHARFRCPDCPRDRKIGEADLRRILGLGLAEVDISSRW